MMKIGIVKETKIPIDRRVPLTPKQCKALMEKFPKLKMVVQPSEIRAFTDQEYADEGVPLQDHLDDCDVLIGVKEVTLDALIPNKIYFFFSHTAKKQPHNKKLLQEILRKNITLIDYEYLVNEDENRIIAFGRYAGIVGAYNGLLAYGKRNEIYELKPAHKCSGLDEMMSQLQHGTLNKNEKLLVTGAGRVGSGAMEVLSKLNIKNVSPEEYLQQEFNEPVLCQIGPESYVKRTDEKRFDLQHFFDHPRSYENIFTPFTSVTDIYFACHFWNPQSPVFFTKEDARQSDFKIQVIADISCDIPGPIPSTLRASTIDDPLYGYHKQKGIEDDPFCDDCITVMAVDNLPCELPKDASQDFGNTLATKVLPHLADEETNDIISKATITKDGELTETFKYLSDYVKG